MKTKNKIHFIVIKSFFIYAVLISLIVFSAAKSESSISAAKSALVLCANTVIPSLFPFFVFSKILVSAGFAQMLKKPASFICRTLFGVSGSGAFAFIMGIISGYPAGASVVCDLYQKKLITRTEARRLLPFCNNSGPLFIIGAVGMGMLGNINAGIFLYIIHVISALFTGIVFRFYDSRGAKNDNQKAGISQEKNTAYSLGKAFSQSIESSVSAVLNICGFIVVFSVFSSALSPLIERILPNSPLAFLLKGFFEITLGIKELTASSQSVFLQLVLSSALIGFGGLCVFLQVAGIVSKTDIGVGTYILGKLFQGIFSGGICFALLKTCDIPVFMQNTALSFNPPQFTQILTPCIVIFTFLFYRFKNRKLF